MFDDHVPETRRSRKVTLALVLLPLWLLASGGGALWLYFHNEKKSAEEDQPRLVTPISADDVDAMMNKIVSFSGERHSSSAEGAKGLTSVMSMVEGTLGPGNTGYTIEKIPLLPRPTGQWPIVLAKLKGKKGDDARALWVVVPCDSAVGSLGAADNASGVAAALSVAKSMAAALPDRTVYFVFLPDGVDRTGPVEQTAKKLQERMKMHPADSVLVVQRLGAGAPGEKLTLSAGEKAKSVTLRAGDSVNAGGELRAEESALAGELEKLGMPVALVSQQAAAATVIVDVKMPGGAALAASAQALETLIRTLAQGG